VADLHGVAVAHPAHQLLEEVARLVLVEPPGLADALEQLAAGRVLHHDRKVRRRQHHLLEADDVGVTKGAVVDDLAENILVDLQQDAKQQQRWEFHQQARQARGNKQASTLKIYPVPSLDELHGHELPRLLVPHQLRHTEVARPDLPNGLVLVHIFLLLLNLEPNSRAPRSICFFCCVDSMTMMNRRLPILLFD
jgi:hypothetical protein